MVLSADQFARALVTLRPYLVSFASRKRSPKSAEPEDLVSEAVRLALLILPAFHQRESTSSTLSSPSIVPGLFAWMTRILTIVIKRDRDRAAHQPRTIPLEERITPILPILPIPTVSPREVIEQKIRSLPDSQRYIVCEWLEGAYLKDIAADYGLHRNTVSNLLNKAFHTMGAQVPNRDFLSFSVHDFDYCRRVVLYKKPAGSFARWAANHPPDIAFKRDGRTRSGFSVRKAA